MFENLKNIAVAVLALALTCISIDLWSSSRFQFIKAAQDIQSSTGNLNSVTGKADRFLNPEVLKNAENYVVTTPAILGQIANSAVDTSQASTRAVDSLNKKMGPVFDNFNLLITEIRTGPVDKSNKLFDSVIKITDEGTLVLGEAKLTIAQVRILLQDPNIVDLIANAAEVSLEVELTALEVRKAIPELLAELKRIESNVADGTGEVSKYLASFNQPQSKGGKALRFILGILLSNARSLR